MKVFYLLLISVTYVLSHNFTPTVFINETRIEGKQITVNHLKVNQYFGIPYAEPPIEDLRFTRTKPLLQLPKVIKATRQPPSCHQYTQNPFPWFANTTVQSEDCLYLNIWTPSSASLVNTKAVMYWIYGGGFRYGSVRQEDVYDASALSAVGDIVVVTVNYRVGPFGFLTTGTKGAPGNAGLWDILEGLRWVNKNIRFFGGDASRVTIAGESAGAIAVGLLSVSPLARGLYQRQIVQSGSPTFRGFDNDTQSLALSQHLATLVGCASDEYTVGHHPEEVTTCLKGVNPIKLKEMDSKINPHSSVDFIPVYGDELLPINARVAIANGNFRCTDLLIGNVRDEGSHQLTTGNPDIFGFFGEKNTFINKTQAKQLMQKQFSSYPNADAIIDHYLPTELPEEPHTAIRYQVYTSIGDSGLLCPTVYYAEKCADKGNRVHFYLWEHRSSTTPWATWMGVNHFTELPFVFGLPVSKPELYNPDEVQISLQMIELWSNFIKFGYPSVFWPEYSRFYPKFKSLRSDLLNTNYGIGPHKQNCDFFRPYFGF